MRKQGASGTGGKRRSGSVVKDKLMEQGGLEMDGAEMGRGENKKAVVDKVQEQEILIVSFTTGRPQKVRALPGGIRDQPRIYKS
eukprot:687507-Hanusia_phi.AAC.1